MENEFEEEEEEDFILNQNPFLIPLLEVDVMGII